MEITISRVTNAKSILSTLYNPASISSVYRLRDEIVLRETSNLFRETTNFFDFVASRQVLHENGKYTMDKFLLMLLVLQNG